MEQKVQQELPVSAKPVILGSITARRLKSGAVKRAQESGVITKMSLPQREGRPSLDLTPDKTPNTASWVTQYNDPMNECNEPVPERKGKPEPNGWTREAFDVNHDVDV